MKLEIELTEEQLSLIIRSLEIHFRFMMGQGSIVSDLLSELPDKSDYADKLAWNRAFEHYLTSRDDATAVLDAAAKILYGADMPADTKNISDMWSVLRNIQYQMHPHDDYDVRSLPPIQLGDMDMIKVKIAEK